MISFKNILVPFDFGEPSTHAVEVAIDLANKYGGALTLLHTWELPIYSYGSMNMTPVDLLTPIQEVAREELATATAGVKKQLANTKAILVHGVAWREIIAKIDELHPDVVVMGTHGRRGVRHLILGSVAEKIVRMSSVPVLTVGAKAS